MWRRSIGIWVAIFVSLLTCMASGAGRATQPATQPLVDAAKIVRLIKLLGNESFAEREAAQKALVEIGLPTVLALKKATTSPDPEIGTRAAVTLHEIGQANRQANHPVNLSEKAAHFLLVGGSRRAAADQFEIAAALDIENRLKWAGELAESLRVMADEDDAFQEPKDPAALPEASRIEYFIFKLRDVAGQQIFVPGKVQVFMSKRENAAWALRRIGKPAIPTLMALLDDRRPTRSTSDSMSGGYVLRYGDVALQIIEAIAARNFDPQTIGGAYLTNADDVTRTAIIESVKDWWAKNRDKTESQWIRESLHDTGLGAMSDHLNWAERLIELDGAASVDFFRQRLAAEPDNGHAVRLLWKAGGKTVLEDMRRSVASKNVYARATAYQALLEAGEKNVVDAVRKDLLEVPTGQPADYRGTLLGALAYSGTREGVLAAAGYMRNADSTIAYEAVRHVFYADQWKAFAPDLAEAILPDVAAAMGNDGLQLDVRYWAASWLAKKTKIAGIPDQVTTPEERTQAIAQVQAWWAVHAGERSVTGTTQPVILGTQPTK